VFGSGGVRRRSSRWHRVVTAALACLGAGVLVGSLAIASSARATQAPSTSALDTRPSVAVSLGDSYIGGMGGRWKGNSDDPLPHHEGTDRAWQKKSGHLFGVVNKSLVYGNTAGSCDRSDSAPILSAQLTFASPVNLACADAETRNVIRAMAGGSSVHGEKPQDDQLATVAANKRVRLIVLSVGGNDVGFGDIVATCSVAYALRLSPCNQTLNAALDSRLTTMAASVGRTLDDIHGTMTDAGYQSGDYRVVLESYPSPVPAPGQDKYSGKAPDGRLTIGGCPLLDKDEAWAANTLVPAVTKKLAAVAGSHGVQFLDLSDAFRGHELCASAAKHPSGSPQAATSEWIRFVDLTKQGDYAESMHPNFYGQQALGRCLALTAETTGNVACHGQPLQAPTAVSITHV
jgi:hypothetical protein